MRARSAKKLPEVWFSRGEKDGICSLKKKASSRTGYLILCPHLYFDYQSPYGAGLLKYCINRKNHIYFPIELIQNDQK